MTSLIDSQERPAELSWTGRDQLALNGRVLQRDDWLELYVFGHWIAGQVDVDITGWYLLTPSQSGIRLYAGLTARFCTAPRSVGTHMHQSPGP
jgi:Domain of unknown function (DUF5348)